MPDATLPRLIGPTKVLNRGPDKAFTPYPARTLYTLVTCSYEINDARTFLFAVEVDEDGNEIGPDEDFLQKMDDLMKEKAQAAAAGTKGVVLKER